MQPTGPGNLSASPSVSAVRLAADPSGRWRLGVIGKRTWSVTQGRCVLCPEQVPLVEEPVYDEQRAVLLHDADTILSRQKVDIVIDGHAYPPGGRTPFDVGVQVGALVRLARVFGPRRATLDATGQVCFSYPEPVEQIPLTWESAYGGVDLAARKDIGDPFAEFLATKSRPADPRFGLFAYPRNPVGRGYVIERTAAALESCSLPLIEDCAALLTPDNLIRGDFVRWPHGPIVAAFGWLPYTYFPRAAMLGIAPLVYDGEHIPPTGFHEVRSGDLQAASVRPDRPFIERLDVGVAQSAAIGLRSARVRPGDLVAVQGLHPRELRWQFPIPAEEPVIAVRFAGESAVELPAQIRTVFLQPDQDRLTLIWTAELLLDQQPRPQKMAGLQHAVLWHR